MTTAGENTTEDSAGESSAVLFEPKAKEGWERGSKFRRRSHSPRSTVRREQSKSPSPHHRPVRPLNRNPAAVPKKLDVEAMQVAASAILPRTLDQFCDECHTVPFDIRHETFPVPEGIRSDPWSPGRTLRVAYITWNMAPMKPDYQKVAEYCIRPNAHIVVVCTQENGCNWYAKRKNQRQWRDHVTHTCLDNAYELVGCTSLWYLHMLVYARREDVAPYVGNVERAKVRTGAGNGLGGNRGGVGIALSISMECELNVLNNSCERRNRTSASRHRRHCIPCTRTNPIGRCDAKSHSSVAAVHATVITLLFVGAHLASGEKVIELRNKHYQSIVKMLQVGLRGKFEGFHREIQRRRALAHTPMDYSGVLDSSGTNDQVACANGDGRTVGASAPACSSSDNDDGGAVGFMKLPDCGEGRRGGETRDATDEFDVVFFGGDLNYRLNGTSKAVQHIVNHQRNIRSILCYNDQLNLERAKGEVFRGFKEGNLHFRPTYKYELMGRGYNATDKSIPAYCDRVLFKRPPHSSVRGVRLRLYTDVQPVWTSDHRPVVAIFDVATATPPK